MTQELSKQICEKCAIAPRYKYIVNYKHLGGLYTLNKEELIKIFSIKGASKVHKVIKVHKLEVDFGEPSNFVKLMELQIRKRTLIELITISYVIVDRRNFLEAVDEYLIVGKYGLRIRKAIREAEWKYE